MGKARSAPSRFGTSLGSATLPSAAARRLRSTSCQKGAEPTVSTTRWMRWCDAGLRTGAASRCRWPRPRRRAMCSTSSPIWNSTRRVGEHRHVHADAVPPVVRGSTWGVTSASWSMRMKRLRPMTVPRPARICRACRAAGPARGRPHRPAPASSAGSPPAAISGRASLPAIAGGGAATRGSSSPCDLGRERLGVDRAGADRRRGSSAARGAILPTADVGSGGRRPQRPPGGRIGGAGERSCGSAGRGWRARRRCRSSTRRRSSASRTLVSGR